MYLDRFKLEGRSAFVTGGAQGIGWCVADALAEAGAAVTIADRDSTALRRGCDMLSAKGHDINGVLLDVTDADAVNAAASAHITRTSQIDILVNNAGIALSEIAAENMDDVRWRTVLDVNLNGAFWCARAFGRFMLTARQGSIFNIGSMSGVIVNRPQGQAHYNSSKAAVHHLTKSLAAEWRIAGCASTQWHQPISRRHLMLLLTGKARCIVDGSTGHHRVGWERLKKLLPWSYFSLQMLQV